MIKINKGDVYENLTVIKEGERKILPSGQVNRTVDCLCSCGNEKNVRLLHLVRGRIKSCGCILKTKKGKSQTLYGILLNSMKTRCKKNHHESHLYYDKGIKVCEEWLNDIDKFISFCKENGYKKGMHIDRIDGNKGYYPENCRFVTPKENANNRNNTFYVNYKGENISLQLLLKKINSDKKPNTVYSRLKRGWTIEEALSKDVGKNYSSRTKKNKN